ncbi:hypothetical protein HDU96_001495 [Phlyctochytrium bullatum]|nr:hypothetical protein HDU96_001495 [Phlyctochytrium bullatum]
MASSTNPIVSLDVGPLALLALCLGDTSDKAFTVDIEGSAPVSRLRSAVANCTRHVASDINLFAVKPGAGVLINDARISTFLASTRWDGGVGVLRVDPTIVETHLPVVWLKDPTDTVAAVCVGDGRDSLLDPALKSKQLRLLVALDGRLDANAATAGAMGAAVDGALPPPAYFPSDAGASSAVGSSSGMLSSGKEKFDLTARGLEAQYGSQGTGSNSATGSLFGTADAADEKKMLAAKYAAADANAYGVQSAFPFFNANSPGDSNVFPAVAMVPAAVPPVLHQPSSPVHGMAPSANVNSQYSHAQPTGFLVAGAPGGVNALNAAGTGATKAADETSSKKKTIILIIIGVVCACLLVVVGAVVGVLLSRKNNNSSDNASQVQGSQSTGSVTTGGGTSTSASASVSATSGAPGATSTTTVSTPTARQGDVLYTLNLPGTGSAGLALNPFNRNTFFSSSTSGSVTEAALNGSSTRDFTVANNDVHGIAVVGNTLICADRTAFSFVNIDGDTRQQSLGAITNFIPTSLTSTGYQVRFTNTGPSANEGVAFLLNDHYNRPPSNVASGFVVLVDTVNANALSYITFTNATEGFPWSVVRLASDRLVVGTNFGLVYEYRRSSSTSGRTWTRVNQFKAHMGDRNNDFADVRTMVLVPGSRYLMTGGWDQRVRVWDLDALPSTPIATVSTPIETPVAEYAAGDLVYAVALSPDESEVIIGGPSKAAVVYPMPQRNRNVQTSTQIWRRDVGWDIWHFAYYNQSGVTGWLVAGNTRSPVVIAD